MLRSAPTGKKAGETIVAEGGGWRKRIGRALRRLIGRPPTPPPVEPAFEPEPNLGSRVPPRLTGDLLDTGLPTFVPPEESGIPPEGPQDDIYMNLLQDMALDDDIYAAELLWAGWFDFDQDADYRADARKQFFAYTGMALWEFDWDQWKDWYEGTGWYATV